MKAIARVLWMLFTAISIQRWLGVAGIVLLSLGLLATESHRSSAMIAALGFGFVVFVAFPATLLAGVSLRTLSAPRTHVLLPHFRLKMLCAAMLFVASVAIVWCAGTLWFTAAASGTLRAYVGFALVIPVGILTALVIGVFASVTRWGWRLTMPALILVVAFGEKLEGLAPLREHGLSNTWLVGIASLVAWAAFGAWYLRARRIRSVSAFTLAPARTGSRSAGRPSELTRAAAERAVIAGHGGEFRAEQWLVSITPLIVGLLALYQLAPRAPKIVAAVTGTACPLLAAACTGLVANLLARRSRLLWLQVPYQRTDLFRRFERAATGSYLVLMTIAVLIAVLALWLVPGTRPDGTVASVVLALSTGSSAMYLGLAAVRGFAAVDIICGLLLLGSVWFAWLGILTEPMHTARLAAVIVLQVAAAVLLRALAVRRWRTIDWLRIRPLRVPSQAMRANAP